MRGVWGTSATDVWVVTTSVGVHRWNGTTWAAVGSVTETGLEVIHGSGSSDVWISNGSIVRHWNGTSWSAATSVGASASVKSLYAISPTDAWAVGDAGGAAIRSHWNGTTWTMTTVYSVTAYQSITGSASNDVWVSGIVNSTTTIEHWDGHAWLRVEPLAAVPPAAVHLFELDAGTLYGATGSAIQALSGLAYSSSDAGNSIFAMASIFTTSDDYIFLGGSANGGTVALFDGTNWGTANVDGSGLACAWGLTGKDTWLVTGYGNPYHYTGVFTPGTFNPPDNFPPVVTSNMWGSSANDIWYAGRRTTSQSAVLHYNGTAWTPRDITPALPSGVWVTRISGSGPNDVWALTSTNRLFRWTGSWAEVMGMRQPIEDMIVTAPNTVILTGGRTAHHGNASGWTADTLPNVPGTPVDLVASGPDFVFGASSTDLFHYDGVRWSLITPPDTTDNGTVIGLGLAPNRLDIAYDPGSANATWVRGLVITQPWRCETSEAGHCADGMDNDCDGAIDARDANCP